MKSPTLHPWLLWVVPITDESFSHFLGDFRRANQLSWQTLVDLLSDLSRDRASSIQTQCDRLYSFSANAKSDSSKERLLSFLYLNLALFLAMPCRTISIWHTVSLTG